MNTIRLQQRGTLTLPKKIRKSLELEEGVILNVTEENNRIILERADSGDKDLLRNIKKSLHEIQQGKFIEFASIPELKKKLKQYDAN